MQALFVLSNCISKTNKNVNGTYCIFEIKLFIKKCFIVLLLITFVTFNKSCLIVFIALNVWIHTHLVYSAINPNRLHIGVCTHFGGKFSVDKKATLCRCGMTGCLNIAVKFWRKKNSGTFQTKAYLMYYLNNP